MKWPQAPPPAGCTRLQATMKRPNLHSAGSAMPPSGVPKDRTASCCVRKSQLAGRPSPSLGPPDPVEVCGARRGDVMFVHVPSAATRLVAAWLLVTTPLRRALELFHSHAHSERHPVWADGALWVPPAALGALLLDSVRPLPALVAVERRRFTVHRAEV